MLTNSTLSFFIQDSKYYISCPSCRVDHLLPEGGAINIPNDFKINSLLELWDKLKMTKKADQTPVNCLKHNDPLKVYCETCHEVICRDCTISIEHNTHDYHLISECYPKHHQQIQDSLDLVNHKLVDIDIAVTCLAITKREVLQQGEQLKKEINTHAQEMIDQIQRSRTHLSQQVDTIVQRKAQVLAAQRESAQRLHSELKTSQEVIERNLNEWTEQQILTKKYTMINAMTQLTDQKPFQPIEEANIEFTKVKNLSIEIGFVTSANNLIATIEKNFPCYPKQPSTVTLTLQSQDGTPLSLPPSLISSTLSSLGVDKPSVKCDITQTHPGEYSITFTPSTRHDQLVVQVGGVDIPDSPFNLPVVPLPEMRGEPVKIITGLNAPQSLAVCDNGDIVVAETGTHCVTILNKNGQKMKHFGKRQFTNPHGVAISIDGEILVTDEHRLQKLTTDGVCVKSVGEGTSGSGRLQFNYPRGIAVHPTTGQIFVADSYNNRIQVFNNDLTFSNIIVALYTPYDVAFDKNNHLHVVEWNNNCITKLNTRPEQHNTRIMSYGVARGLSFPSSLAIHDNLVYVGEWGDSRVSIFDTDGNFLHSFSTTGVTEFQHSTYTLGVGIDPTGVHLYISDVRYNKIIVY